MWWVWRRCPALVAADTTGNGEVTVSRSKSEVAAGLHQLSPTVRQIAGMTA